MPTSSQRTAAKTDPGRFFEDFRLGETLRHATPRTLTEGDRALYGALYPSRFALASSDPFARACGLPRSPLDDLATFHVAFGKTVPDVSLNAVANLGYAELRFHRRAFPGDTVSTTSAVIGIKETSNRKTGVVWVRSRATDQEGRLLVEWVRWVLVRKRDEAAPAPEPVTPTLAEAVAASDLVLPEGLHFRGYDAAAAGSAHIWGDYAVGERIDHVDGVTIEDAEHMLATRLWQNTAKVHFDTRARPDGRRLVYGGHVMSLARALSFNGLGNAQLLAAVNGGAHANPCFAGDRVSAWSEVLDRAETAEPSVGALRLRTVATTGDSAAFPLKGPDGKHAPDVLLELDYWALAPRRS